jgi:hypothetical protein
MKDVKAGAAASQAAKLKAYASGGAVTDDGGMDEPMSAVARSSRSTSRGLSGLEGAPAKTRLDRKSAGKGKAGTNVNIIIAPKGGGSEAPVMPMMGPPPMLPPMPMAKPPMPMPPPGPAPMGPPPVDPMLGRKHGGRVKKDC